MQALLQPYFDVVGGFLWGWPMLTLLVLTGIWLTVSLGFVQFVRLPLAFRTIFRRSSDDQEGDISHFQSLTTALAATVGTGNIAGVATAIALGGPGSLFWMWMTGIIGMATKFAEAVLGVHYRLKEEDGTMGGGPMYYITHGLKDVYGWNAKWLATLFAFCLALAALGIGNMVQSNSIADLAQTSLGVSPMLSGLVLMVLAALVLFGGVQRIGAITAKLVPFMILLYVGVGTVIVVLNAHVLGNIFQQIFHAAFTPASALGGFAGAALKEVLRQGVSRGVFSNESGMGSSPIAAAAARTRHPVEQALVSMTQTFIDTLVVCTFTGLIILISGLYMVTDDMGNQLNGASLTGLAFSSGLGHHMGAMIVTVCLAFFAFSTILGWGYYGDRAVTYLFGKKGILPFKVLFLAAIMLGAMMELKLAWNIAEICTGLMILPNLIAVVLLSGKVRRLTRDYFRHHLTCTKFKEKPFYKG